MRKVILLLVVIVFIFNACNKKGEDFIGNFVNQTTDAQSVHYKLTQKYYYSNGQDTTITPNEIWVVRDKNDTLRNAYIWVDDFYRPYNMIYTNGTFYLVIPPKKVTALYPNFTSSFVSEIDWVNIFLNPEMIQDQFNDSLNITSITDTVYDGKKCKKIYIEFPLGKKEEKKSFIYVIDKKDNSPLFALKKVEYKDYTYFDEIYFSDYEFDNVILDDLKKRQQKVITQNPIEDKKENSNLSMLEQMLHLGDKAPIFDGKFHNSDNNFALENYIGENIIIVDFWYTHCPPCVKAIPALSELQKEYGDKGLKIFGLNSVDNQDHSIDYLNKFLSKRDVSYDIIMTQAKVDLMYKVKGYPTIYLIDKNGEIAHIELGFNQEKFEELKEKTIELLNKE
ncbi:MAG: TlpA disulfide reductase family protein [Bacteroidota bacterium]|nr:TlpA disulfide reductase family protein [Bacteroidota bacterium]